MHPQDIRISPQYLQALESAHRMQIQASSGMSESLKDIAKSASDLREYFTRAKAYEQDRAYMQNRHKIEDERAERNTLAQLAQLRQQTNALKLANVKEANIASKLVYKGGSYGDSAWRMSPKISPQMQVRVISR